MIGADFCRNWLGPASADSALAARGFKLHCLYKKSIINLCQNYGIEVDLDYYFNEVAREYISSKSMDNNYPDRGSFRNNGFCYNSEYLDNLWRNRGKFERETYPYDNIFCGLAVFLKEIESKEGFRNSFNKYLKERLSLEIDSYRDISINYKEIPLKKLFVILCDEYKFTEIENIRKFKDEPKILYARKLHNGFIIYFYLENIIRGNNGMGGNFNIPVSIAYNKIRFREDQQFGNMSMMVPGLDRYCGNIPEDGFFVAFSAYFTCIEAIAYSFSDMSVHDINCI